MPAKTFVAAVIFAAMAGGTPLPPPSGGPATGTSVAADSSDEILTRNGVRYVCTGIGATSRSDPRWAGFPAKLVYAIRDGGFLSGVETRIADTGGTEVITATCDAPWLLVDLAPGDYLVTATKTIEGTGQVHAHRARISVGTGRQSELVIRFPEISE